jgi:two-component system KDP operon response regulator KdpE
MSEEEPRRVLIVDDDTSLMDVLEQVLSAAGHAVITAVTGAEAVAAAQNDAPELILLDLGLPDADGKDIVSQIREFSTVPIIVISARHQGAEKIAALDLGADDFVHKPFDIEELMARMRAALRRTSQTITPLTHYEHGDLKIDLTRRLITLMGQRIDVSPKEFKLLAALARSAGQVITHKRLMIAGWGSDRTDPQYLRVYIGQLRQKIEEDPAAPRFILTEPGIGYRMAEPD